VVALVFGFRLQPGQVGPGARLGITLAPANLAARDAIEMQLLLLLVAVLEQRRSEQSRSHAEHGIAPAHAKDFLRNHPRFRRRQPGAAIGLGPIRRAPSLRDHALLPELPVRPFRVARRQIVVLVELARDRRRQVLLDPALHFGAERFETFGINGFCC
jgi:hypothetical protein